MKTTENDTMVVIPLLQNLTFREWHAFVNGFYSGFTSDSGGKGEYDKEKHYWRSGYLAGWAAKTAFLLGLIRRFGPGE